MSIFDAVKKSVLEGFSSEITLFDILLSLFAAFLAGIFILFIYRLTLRTVSRNRSFEITLLLVTPIASMIVLTITSNLALSLGMVGALSIIRFRTAIKDASDTAFMFWAVAAGITSGAHFYKITIIGCLFIGLAAFTVIKLSENGSRPYLLIIRSKDEKIIAGSLKMLNDCNIRNRMSSYVTNSEYTEVIYETAVNGNEQKIVASLSKLPEIITVSLVDCRN